jgi:hypothetical protein
MALIYKKDKPKEIPEDAVQMTEEQAIRYQMSIIEKWPKLSDV